MGAYCDHLRSLRPLASGGLIPLGSTLLVCGERDTPGTVLPPGLLARLIRGD